MYWCRHEAQYKWRQSAIDYFYLSGTSVSQISHLDVINLSCIRLFCVNLDATLMNLFGVVSCLSPLFYFACSIMYLSITYGILCFIVLLDIDTYECYYSSVFFAVLTFTNSVFDRSSFLIELLFRLLSCYFI